VFACSADGSDERRLTRVNETFFATVELSEPEETWLPSASDDRRPIYAWILKPVGFREGVRYPLVLEIHGGPHAMYSNVYFHEFQLLAAQGYVVLYPNPRGSQGYGQQFLSSTRCAWGEADMPDLMGALDAALAPGYVDPHLLGVTGGSYGGFLTNWLIGHSDRLKAAVTQRSVSNLISFDGTSDIGFHFAEHEIGGTPWEEPERYRRLSPLTDAPQMTTPLLILHSEQDYRCPIEQAEQLFVWLKKLGRTVGSSASRTRATVSRARASPSTGSSGSSTSCTGSPCTSSRRSRGPAEPASGYESTRRAPRARTARDGRKRRRTGRRRFCHSAHNPQARWGTGSSAVRAWFAAP